MAKDKKSFVYLYNVKRFKYYRLTFTKILETF